MVKKITKVDIVNLFLNNYNGKYYLRELASLLKKPHQSIKPYVEVLVKEEVLIKYKRKNLVEYGLNFENKRIFDYLVIAEKEKLISKLNKEILLKVLFEKISESFMENTFIIFGSSTKRIQKNSDIDLLIIGKSSVNKIISEFEDVYNKKIHKVQINDLNKLSDTLIKEVYKKHLIFNDTEKIIRFFGGLHEKNMLV